MKIAFLLLFLTFVGRSFCQQNPFVREGSIGEVKIDIPTRIGPGTLELESWPGQKFILLPKSSDSLGYFLDFEPRLSYREWVGKTLVASKIDKQPAGGQGFRKVHFRSEDGKSITADLIGEGIHEIAPIRDLEFARDRWLGKKIWIKRGDLATWNVEKSEFGSVRFKNCSPVVVTDVVAGWFDLSPIRFIIKVPDGRIGFVDISVSGTNVAEQLREFEHFEKRFMEADPRLTKAWTEETWKAIEDGEVFIGMTSEQVEWSWGKPKKVTQMITARGSEQQWIYHDNRVVFVSEGKVSAAQN